MTTLTCAGCGLDFKADCASLDEATELLRLHRGTTAHAFGVVRVQARALAETIRWWRR